MSSKAAPKGAAPAAGAEAPPKKSKKLLIIIILAVVLLAGGGGAAWFFLRAKPAEGEHVEKKKEAPKPPVFLVLEQFVVNLQPENGDQFLQTAISLQLSDAHAVDAMKVYMPIIRNRILVLLSAKKASEISTPEGKKKLGEEVMAALKEPLLKGGEETHIDDVLFTSFVIQ